MNFILNIINLINNIEIIFTKKNIDNISSISILQNKSKNIIICHLIYNNFLLIQYYIYLLYFYYIIGFFVKLKFMLIDCEETEIVETLKFFNKTNHEFIIITKNKSDIFLEKINSNIKLININEDLLNNYIKFYEVNLTNDQLIFYNKISFVSNPNNLVNNDILFLKGINKFIEKKYFTILLLWEISYEGETSIDIFIEDGKYI